MGVTLPSTITVDVSQHQPTQLPCPDGWLVMRLNGRAWIAKESKNIVMLDAAQYGMLVDIHRLDAPCSPTMQLSETIRESN